MWSIHTMEYYSAFKRKEILTQDTTWMKLEDAMLSEISQIKMKNILWFHLPEAHRGVKFKDRK